MALSSQEAIWISAPELHGNFKPHSLACCRYRGKRRDSQVNAVGSRKNGAGIQSEEESKRSLWEDRYHAAAVESGDHLARCMVYIDTNMVRAGVVNHPSMWSFSGYNEIQEALRKNILIDYDRLRELFGVGSYDELRNSHRGWIEEYPGSGAEIRRDGWTGSIAIGSRSFVENVKTLLGLRAKGRRVMEGGGGYQLPEEAAHYISLFGAEKDDIAPKNTYFWDVIS